MNDGTRHVAAGMRYALDRRRGAFIGQETDDNGYQA